MNTITSIAAGTRVLITDTGQIGVVKMRRVMRDTLSLDSEAMEPCLVVCGRDRLVDSSGQFAVEVTYADHRRGWVFARAHELQVLS